MVAVVEKAGGAWHGVRMGFLPVLWVDGGEQVWRREGVEGNRWELTAWETVIRGMCESVL